jgi:ferritin
MQYTNKSSVLFNFLKAYVPEEIDPEEDVTDIFLYVQNVTTAIDFYVLQYSSEFGDMLALVDPLHDPQVL